MAYQRTFLHQARGISQLVNRPSLSILTKVSRYSRSFGAATGMEKIPEKQNFESNPVEAWRVSGSFPPIPTNTLARLSGSGGSFLPGLQYVAGQRGSSCFAVYPLRIQSLDTIINGIQQRALQEGTMRQQGHARFYAGLISDIINMSFDGVIKRQANSLPQITGSGYRLEERFTMTSGIGILVMDQMNQIKSDPECLDSMVDVISKMDVLGSTHGPFYIILVDGPSFRIFHFSESSKNTQERNQKMAWFRQGRTTGKAIKVFSVAEVDGVGIEARLLNSLSPATNILFHILLKSFQDDLHLRRREQQRVGNDKDKAIWKQLHELSEWCRAVLCGAYDNRRGKEFISESGLDSREQMGLRGHYLLRLLTTTYIQLNRGMPVEEECRLLGTWNEMNCTNRGCYGEGDKE